MSEIVRTRAPVTLDRTVLWSSAVDACGRTVCWRAGACTLTLPNWYGEIDCRPYRLTIRKVVADGGGTCSAIL
jgi:hypothetical protein